MGDIRVGDVGTTLRINAGRDISNATLLEIIMTRDGGGERKTFTGTLSGTQYVLYVTTAAADIPEEGSWTVQIHVVQPTTTRRSTITTLAVDAAL